MDIIEDLHCSLNILEADKLEYQIFPHVNETETYILSDHKLRIKHYLLYQKIAWIRVFQIPKAIFYKNIILQRSLFPHYPLYNKPIFEKFYEL